MALRVVLRCFLHTKSAFRPPSSLRRSFPLKSCLPHCSRGYKHESYQVVYDQHGDPGDVLYHREEPVRRSLMNNEVLIKMLLAPVHPIDLDTINGFTDEHHCLPAVGGCEGVGVVEKIGCGAIDLNNGDWVVSKGFNWGTWQTMAVADAADVMRVPKDIPLLGAATLAGNACTAYRLLKDFVDLKPRDVIIQNGANGAVGQAVMQLAREWGIITVNVVRDRPKIKALSEYLQGRGATHVITDTFLKSSSMQFFMKSLPGTPKLALNCVGGKLNVEMMKYMPFESVLVTYGEVSHEPVVMPANVISNKRMRCEGYSQTNWNNQHGCCPQFNDMVSELCELMRVRKFLPPDTDYFTLDYYPLAIRFASQPLKARKVVFKIDEDLIM